MQLLFYHRRPGAQANDGANGSTLLSVIGMLFKEGLLFCRRCSEAQADRMRRGLLPSEEEDRGLFRGAIARVGSTLRAVASADFPHA